MKIAAVIVLYNPELERLKENVNAAAPQVEKLILVDNGSKNIDAVISMIGQDEKIVFVRNEKNLGIAEALNQGMQVAYDNDYAWVLTLDQDSVVPPNLIEELTKHVKAPKVAMVAPEFNDRNVDRKDDWASGCREIERCITSAALTKVDVWKKIGGFDSDLFIDYVDYDYCARLLQNGYKILQDADVRILHEIGHSTCKKIGPFKVVLFHESAFRVYYSVRNRLYYCKRYADVADVKQERINLLYRYVMVLLFEEHRFKKLKAILRGIRDSRKLLRTKKIRS